MIVLRRVRAETRWLVLLSLAALAGCGGAPKIDCREGAYACAAGFECAESGDEWLCVNGAIPTSGVPEALPRYEPGLLTLKPRGIVLAPSGMVTVDVGLFGQAPGDALGTLAVVSSAPDVVTASVSSLSTVQLVAGSKQAVAEIEIDDGIHAPERLVVAVTSTPPNGPTGVSFDPPMIALEPGEQAAVEFQLWSSGGASGDPVSFSVAPPAIARVTARSVASVSVRAGDPGFAAVEARASASIPNVSQPLVDSAIDGQLLVAVASADAKGECGFHTLGCGLVNAPVAFDSRGLSAPPLRLRVVEFDSCTVDFRVVHRAPSLVEIDDSRIVDLAEGRLVSGDPGTTRVRVLDGDFACEELWISVYPDLNGPWNATCSNGDQGGFTLSDWPLEVSLRKPAYAPSIYPFDARAARGTGCFTGPGDFDCSASAWLYAGWSFPVTEGKCLETAPCIGLGSHCAASRHGFGEALDPKLSGVRFLGPDRFELGVCSFERGAPDCGSGGGGGEPCQYDVECSGGDVCNYGYFGVSESGISYSASCHAPSKLGERCGWGNCADGLVCYFGFDDTTICAYRVHRGGTCVPIRVTGEECDCGGQCESGACSGARICE